MMRPSAVLLMLVIAIASIGWISSANADIDPANPNYLMYRDTYSADDSTAGYYDYYQEVAQGDTFTVHIVLNRDAPWGSNGMRYMNKYVSMFWWDTAVIDNVYNGDGSRHPTPNYAYSWLYFTQTATAQFEIGNYAQLTNVHAGGSVDNMDVSSRGSTYENPLVVLSWDIPIRADAPLGETTIPLKFYSYYTWMNPNPIDVIEPADPDLFALTINVIGVPPSAPGDFDGDGDVDGDDVVLLCNNLGGDPDPYDVDEDGDVDEDDLILLIENLVELTDGSGRTGTKRGDFNLDGFVDGTDLALMKTAFGQPGMAYADGNANCDAFVDGTDLAILKTNFGFIAPTGGGVPEPMTIGLLSLGGLGLLRRKRS